MSQSERAKPEKDEQAGPAGLGEAAGTAGQEGRAPSLIGVLGAGTMGSGIAQLAARSGARALLHDPIAEALERGGARARDGLGKEAEKGRLTEEQARAAAERLQEVSELSEFAQCAVVIGAAPERLQLK